MKKNPVFKASFALLASAIIFYCFDFYLRISSGLIVDKLLIQYHTTATGIGLLASAFYYGYTLMQIPGGLLLDHIKLKPLLAITILICIVACFGFIHTHSLWFAIVCRFLIGLGSAISFIVVLYIAQRFMPKQWFVFISGLTISLGTFIGSLVQTYIAPLVMQGDWHLIYFVITSFGFVIIALVLCIPRLNESKKSITEFNANVFKTMWTDFYQLLRNKTLLTIGLIGGVFYFPTSVLGATWGIDFLGLQFHLDKAQSAVAITYLFLGWAICSPLMGFFTNNFNRLKWVSVTCSLAAFCIMVLLLTSYHLLAQQVNVLFLIFGLFSSGQVTVWGFFNYYMKDKESGLALAFVNMLIMLSTAVAQMLVGYCIDWHHSKHQYPAMIHQAYSISDLHFGLSFLPAAFILTAMLTLCLIKKIKQ